MSADSMDHDDKGVVGITIAALAAPFGALRSLTGQRGDRRRPAATRVGLVVAFAPLVVMYEALAVPLVAGTLLFGAVLMVPFVVIARVGALVGRVSPGTHVDGDAK